MGSKGRARAGDFPKQRERKAEKQLGKTRVLVSPLLRGTSVTVLRATSRKSLLVLGDDRNNSWEEQGREM
jgi:hypothetical protein